MGAGMDKGMPGRRGLAWWWRLWWWWARNRLAWLLGSVRASSASSIGEAARNSPSRTYTSGQSRYRTERRVSHYTALASASYGQRWQQSSSLLTEDAPFRRGADNMQAQWSCPPPLVVVCPRARFVVVGRVVGAEGRTEQSGPPTSSTTSRWTDDTAGDATLSRGCGMQRSEMQVARRCSLV